MIAERDKERLRTEALGLGFAACGFTDAGPLDCADLLGDWLAEGRHGHMDYLARPGRARVEPGRLLAEARSVVVVAREYPAPPPPDPEWRRKLRGRVAAYASGADYHDGMRTALEELARSLAGLGGRQCRVQVDSGPLLEKELARRSGIGWYGRNTNILAKPSGSYFLLGCLLTDAYLDPDPPFDDTHCGQCTACIPACPTGALDSGPTIDAPRCISYLTIEHRGPLPQDLRAKLGNWVFGCDLCQEVCPWNEDSEVSRDPLLSPYLPDLLEMSEERCRETYRRTALWRAKRRGLARNAAVALGNSGNPEAVAPLSRALATHDEALVRAHSAWALGEVGGSEARTALERAQASERVPPVRDEIARSLAGQALRGPLFPGA